MVSCPCLYIRWFTCDVCTLAHTQQQTTKWLPPEENKLSTSSRQWKSMLDVAGNGSSKQERAPRSRTPNPLHPVLAARRSFSPSTGLIGNQFCQQSHSGIRWWWVKWHVAAVAQSDSDRSDMLQQWHKVVVLIEVTCYGSAMRWWLKWHVTTVARGGGWLSNTLDVYRTGNFTEHGCYGSCRWCTCSLAVVCSLSYQCCLITWQTYHMANTLHSHLSTFQLLVTYTNVSLPQRLAVCHVRQTGRVTCLCPQVIHPTISPLLHYLMHITYWTIH